MRLHGLDSLRFICAFVVLMSHLGVPSLTDAPRWSVPWIASQALQTAWNGQAAVIVFFVLSGLVIHRARPTPDVRYFVRRFVRVGVPMLAALAIAYPLGAAKDLGLVLWSVYAELIYYAAYPGMLALRRRASWMTIALCGLPFSFAATALFGPAGGNVTAFNPAVDALVGLPCWVLGCHVAEGPVMHSPTRRRMWRWRIGIWAASFAALHLRFRLGIPYGYTLVPFAFLVVPWLRAEIAYYEDSRPRRPWRDLETAGQWSYSLYLAHVIVLSVFASMEGFEQRWSLAIVPVAVASAYLFAVAVEYPAHALARRLAAIGRPATSRGGWRRA